MRQNFSSPTLSPLPPYPVGASSKERQDLPATAPPSPDLTPVEFADLADSAESEPVDNLDDMRATRVRPRTAPASPERPSTARSTIRQVNPSPDSLSDSFVRGFANGGTPAPEPSFEPFPPFNTSSSTEDVGVSDAPTTHIPSTEPAAGVVAGGLRRGGTPSGHSLPRKSRSCSPQKSRSASPRKHTTRTPSLPAHQESPSSSYSAEVPEKLEAPDTPSPVSREQKKQAYAPLRIRRPFTESNSEGELAEAQNTHARIADYMRKMRTQQRGVMNKSYEGKQEKIDMPRPVKRVVASVPHIVQAMVQPHDTSPTEPPPAPVLAAPVQTQSTKEPNRHASISRKSEASGASVASKHSVFSTPGRDEMERKKPIVEEDEGPFARATNVQDLEQSRRRVSEGTKIMDEEDEKKRPCGMKCVVM